MALGRLTAAAALALLCASPMMAQNKICIDPGHGGSDPGAVGGGQTEAANVLDTGLRFRTWLNTDTADTAGGGSWNVIMTRTSDVTVELASRTSFANNNSANRFLSIHNNAAQATSANGMETFCWGSGSSTSFDLRNKVQEEGILAWPITNRGNKTANFYVIRYTNMPSELHEMGFITNTGDRAYLGSATERDKNARAHMFAVQRNYGLAKYTPSTAVVVTADNVPGSFSVSGSAWFTGTSIPGYIGANYHARATEAVSDPATWTVNLPSAGTYRVDAIWTSASNRAAAAPYQVVHTGGTTTVNRNQQTNGGTWQSLGNFSFNAGSNTVRLSCWTTAGFFVIADAVRFTRL